MEGREYGRFRLMKQRTHDKAILVLEYHSVPNSDQSMLQREWSSTCKAIRSTKCLHLFFGQMNHKKGTTLHDPYVYPVKNIAKV